MAKTIIMPKLGLTMTYGVITEWYVKEGDTIKEGDPAFAIETDKISTDVEAPASGTVLKILAQTGESKDITEPCAIIGEIGEDINGYMNGEVSNVPAETVEEVVQAGTGTEAGTGDTEDRIFVSPNAKRIAAERGIDLSGIKPEGIRITSKDVLRLSDKGETTSAAIAELIDQDVIKKMTPMRKTIARRLSQSKQTIPHAYFKTEANVDKLLTIKNIMSTESLNKTGVKITMNDLILKAVALVLHEFGDINARLDDENITYFAHVNLGFAVSVPGGLIVPVIKNAESFNLNEISAQARDLTERAREGKLKPEEYSGGTFTVSNLGGYGLEEFSAIINPPESGILAVGTITRKPVDMGNEIKFSSFMCLTASFDHRLVDGALAAQFIKRLKEILEEGETLCMV